MTEEASKTYLSKIFLLRFCTTVACNIRTLAAYEEHSTDGRNDNRIESRPVYEMCSRISFACGRRMSTLTTTRLSRNSLTAQKGRVIGTTRGFHGGPITKTYERPYNMKFLFFVNELIFSVIRDFTRIIFIKSNIVFKISNTSKLYISILLNYCIKLSYMFCKKLYLIRSFTKLKEKDKILLFYITLNKRL